MKRGININFKRQGGWVQIAALALGAIGLVSSFVGAKKGEEAAKEQAALEAEQEEKVTKERLRQLGIDERVLFGETLAGYAGGGVLAAAPSLGRRTNVAFGSPQQIIQEQAKEFKAQRKITADVGATKVQQALAGGASLADQYRYSGYANVASGISNILTNWQLMKG